ncbi:putative cytochrome P450 E-class, group IV [Podospora australis]|uniref:Cytochrome P450 E-class, group IV n=1 Tax=Podospora australis TaxID=1536484 RepID=A0AAN6WVX8_9PEZI|nr:putative cytochrome P450 E-class, group IV [Podospora australis]
MAVISTASGYYAIVGLLTFLTYRYIFYPVFLSSLARIPNAHWSAPLSSLWILNTRFSRRENRTLAEAHRLLGPIVRVGPDELSISDLGSLRTVYQGGFEKPAWYSVFDNYGVPCMFSTRQATEHSIRKRFISHVYSKSFIHSSPATTAQAHAILSERLLPSIEESLAESQRPHGIDVYSVFMGATMDFITGFVYGLKYGTDFLADKAYREHMLEMYKARGEYAIYDQELPRLTKFCRRLGIPLCPWSADSANRELCDWIKRLCDNMMPFIANPEAAATNPRDEPVVWKAVVGGLRKEEAANGKESLLYSTALTNFELSVASELLDHVLAGQETAGLALTYLSWRLSQSLDLQVNLRAELLSLSPNLRVGPDGRLNNMPDPKQLDSLPLLHAVLTETLRLHAPIPGPQPRETPASGCHLGDYFVPGGVRVAALAHTLHREEIAFPDPETWDHTRWLPTVSTEEERKLRNRYFWAFGSGGRMCVGSNFAWHEMKLIVAAIYSNYTSHIVDDTGVKNQADGYTNQPDKERLYIRFERAR